MSFVVTIDGPAAAGKSSTARAVAARLGFLYVDTGALYRALALKLRSQGVSLEDPEAIDRCIAETRIELSGSPAEPHVWLDGTDVSGEIRTPAVSELSSRLAAMPAVRLRLREVQRRLRDRGPLVAEGRDLGTVVFPEADVKIFLDADLEVRARRRARELVARGIAAPLDEVRSELARRDERDRSRADSPLRPAPDATVVDGSRMDVEHVVEEVLRSVRAHPGFPSGSGAGRAGGEAPGRSGSEPGTRGPTSDEEFR